MKKVILQLFRLLILGKTDSNPGFIGGLLLELRFFIGVFIFTYFIVQPFIIAGYKVPSCSMEPTIMTNTRFIGLPSIYGAFVPFSNLKLPQIKEVKRGDVVVFKFPKDEKTNYVKRVIGLPGETVVIKNRIVYINGEPLGEPYTQFVDSDNTDSYNNDDDIFEPAEYGPVTVPGDHLFVLGDNRERSWDSRYWGFVPIKNVFGKPLVTFWSYDQDTRSIRLKELFKVIK